MSDKKTGKGIVDRIWDVFSSIKLAVVVFSLISLTSIVGTVLEQQADPEKNTQLLVKMFGIGHDPAHSVLGVLESLGFTDMYHSWWFMALLFIFAANLVICSIDRLPRILKAVNEPVKPLSPEQFKVMTLKREVVLKERLDSAKGTMEAALQKAGFKAGVSQEDGSLQLYAEKGRYSRLGVYVTHLSILLILIGAVVGLFLGYNGSLNLLEGTSSPVAYMGKGIEVPLGFEIRCDDFDVSYYDNSDTPKSYRSWLTVLDNGREVMKKEIEVNTPLKYKGITFYQSSYGYSPNQDSLFRFTVTANDGKKQDTQLKFGQAFEIPGTKVTAKVLDFSPALSMDQSGKLFTYAEMMNNPAVFLEFAEEGKHKYNQWILKRYPETWRVQDGMVEFKDLWGAQYTGLQVRKDPGVWIVYLGCIIMGIGLYAAFFMSHARIWVRLREEKSSTRVDIAASSNKNKLAFEQKIEKLVKSVMSPKS